MPRSRPSRARAHALVLVDVINDFDFPGADALIRAAEAASVPLARLAARARAAGVPVLYVNDNFGRWRSDWRTVVTQCVSEKSRGHRVARRTNASPRVVPAASEGRGAGVIPVLVAEGRAG